MNSILLLLIRAAILDSVKVFALCLGCWLLIQALTHTKKTCFWMSSGHRQDVGSRFDSNGYFWEAW